MPPSTNRNTPEERKAFWESMRADWIAGVKPIAQLAREYRVSRAAIVNHWTDATVSRNKVGEIREQAQAMVQRVEAGGQLEPQPAPAPGEQPSQTQIVLSNAAIQASKILAHRSAVQRAMLITERLFLELEAQTAQPDFWLKVQRVLTGAIAKTTGPNAGNKLTDKTVREAMDAMNKATTHSARVGTNKQLVETLDRLVSLERRVLNIADDTPVDAGERDKQERDQGIDGLRKKFDTILKRAPAGAAP